MQHKELEVRLKELEKAKEAAATRADQLGQDILRLDEAVTAAEEKRKGLRKQLAQVRSAAWQLLFCHGWKANRTSCY
jgi:predicted  nucleic acid-binding Zn-ribbon protein